MPRSRRPDRQTRQPLPADRLRDGFTVRISSSGGAERTTEEDRMTGDQSDSDKIAGLDRNTVIQGGIGFVVGIIATLVVTGLLGWLEIGG